MHHDASLLINGKPILKRRNTFRVNQTYAVSRYIYPSEMIQHRVKFDKIKIKILLTIVNWWKPARHLVMQMEMFLDRVRNQFPKK